MYGGGYDRVSSMTIAFSLLSILILNTSPLKALRAEGTKRASWRNRYR